MTETLGLIRRPKATWGGRWSGPLEDLVAAGALDDAEWVDVVDYAGTVAYQVARTLNLAAELQRLADRAVGVTDRSASLEFASRRETANRSVLLVRIGA